MSKVIEKKDSDLRPVSAAFKAVPSLSLGDSTRRACRDEKGVWRNALNLESTETHRHVAKVWQDKCIPMLDFMEQLETTAIGKKDKIVDTMHLRLRPDMTVEGGYGFTEWGFSSLLSFTGVNMGMASFMLSRGHNEELANIVNSELNRRIRQINGGDRMLVRMRVGADGQKVIRAVMSQDYRVFDNVDLARLLASCLPSAAVEDVLVSHAWSDDDNFTATFLLPDFIKSNPDSDYGVGINGGNSEVGLRATTAMAELFRAICFNGNKWDLQRSDSTLRKIHAGDCDLGEIRNQLMTIVNIARTEGVQMIDLMNASKQVTVSNPRETIAYLARENRLTQEEGQNWLVGYQEGLLEPMGDANDRTAFGVYNGLTRSAQKSTGYQKIALEGVASKVLAKGLMSDLEEIEDRWKTYSKAGQMLSEKVVEQYAGVY